VPPTHASGGPPRKTGRKKAGLRTRKYLPRQPGHLRHEDPRLSAPSSRRVWLYRNLSLSNYL